jgi:hypothetical protein
MTCLQAPQGLTGYVASGQDMASAVKPFLPWARAETRADRSAQMVIPNDLFSTFAAVTTVPSSQSKAAPTLNFE